MTIIKKERDAIEYLEETTEVKTEYNKANLLRDKENFTNRIANLTKEIDKIDTKLALFSVESKVI